VSQVLKFLKAQCLWPQECGLGEAVTVAHTCSPIYLGGWNWEDCGSRPAW
jgi:hypothetical protein